MNEPGIKIGQLGIGVIGNQVARVLLERAENLTNQIGAPIQLKKVKVLPADLENSKTRQFPAELFTLKDEEIFEDPEIRVVVELIGGEHPAYTYITQALQAGKHVVTANKEVMAKHGIELIETAHRNGVSIYYEASVGGGIPIIAPLNQDLRANYIKSIYAIINGTTNYILTRMSQEGTSFEQALKNAQKLGYAESNPVNDVEGIDATYKLAIMATLAFQTRINPEDIYHEGISRLSARDFKYARELGYNIKLLAIAKQYDDSLEARVHPVMIREGSYLANVNGVINAIRVEGDLVGQVIFSGQGAGPMATSSAIVSDILRASKDITANTACPKLELSSKKTLKNIDLVVTRYYMRLNITDSSGVLARIARVLGEHGISISSVIQKETDTLSKTAEIVIMTHPANTRSVEAAIAELGRLDVVKEINNVIRVEE